MSKRPVDETPHFQAYQFDRELDPDSLNWRREVVLHEGRFAYQERREREYRVLRLLGTPPPEEPDMARLTAMPAESIEFYWEPYRYYVRITAGFTVRGRFSEIVTGNISWEQLREFGWPGKVDIDAGSAVELLLKHRNRRKPRQQGVSKTLGLR